MTRTRNLLLLALALWLAAAAVRWVAAPAHDRLPADYGSETLHEASVRTRHTPDGKWDETPIIARRVDQTMVAEPDHSLIQADMYWARPDGTLEFESKGLYAVDRTTRQNIPGLGDADRSGHFLLPPGVEKRDYQLWDPHMVGPRTLEFVRSQEVDGHEALLFRSTVTALDESAGYAHLPDVPERYRALTDAQGTVTIDAATGLLLDYTLAGHSYFADPETLEPVAVFFEWSETFTPATRVEVAQRVSTTRRMSMLLHWVLPITLLLIGAALAVVALRRGASAR